jgi:hypothetical protein
MDVLLDANVVTCDLKRVDYVLKNSLNVLINSNQGWRFLWLFKGRKHLHFDDKVEVHINFEIYEEHVYNFIL